MSGRLYMRTAWILVLVLVGGCANLGAGSVDTFITAVRQVHYDFTVYESPRALANAATVVVVGTITAVFPGRSVDGIGPHATLAVTVDRLLKGSDDLAPGGRVYVEIPTTPKATVEAYRASAPIARVLLFLDDRTGIPGTGSTGAPTGSRIYAPWSTGMVFEYGDGFAIAHEDVAWLPEGWSLPASFDDLVASLE